MRRLFTQGQKKPCCRRTAVKGASDNLSIPWNRGHECLKETFPNKKHLIKHQNQSVSLAKSFCISSWASEVSVRPCMWQLKTCDSEVDIVSTVHLRAYWSLLSCCLSKSSEFKLWFLKYLCVCSRTCLTHVQLRSQTLYTSYILWHAVYCIIYSFWQHTFINKSLKIRGLNRLVVHI